MRQVFADTFYWIALTSARDEWHEEAKRLSTGLAGAILVTVEEVLIEFLTWFASRGPTGRAHAVATVRRILEDPSSRVIPGNSRRAFSPPWSCTRSGPTSSTV